MLRRHPWSLIDELPPRSPALAKPIPDDIPMGRFGQNVDISAFAYIQRGVEIGDDTLIGVHASIFYGAKIGKNCIIGRAAQIGPNVVIGDNVKILDGAHVCGESVIGDGSIIAMHVMMGNDKTPLGWEWKGVQPVIVGRNCQIGYSACLNPGVTVGDGAKVATNATVTKDVPPNAIVRGEAARIIVPEVAA